MDNVGRARAHRQSEDNIKLGLNSENMSNRFICLGIGIIQGEFFHQMNY
jgi:hypothetical protein